MPIRTSSSCQYLKRNLWLSLSKYSQESTFYVRSNNFAIRCTPKANLEMPSFDVHLDYHCKVHSTGQRVWRTKAQQHWTQYLCCTMVLLIANLEQFRIIFRFRLSSLNQKLSEKKNDEMFNKEIFSLSFWLK